MHTQAGNVHLQILPLEKEWERERLSCTLFAGDDENKQQVIWDE